MRLYTTDQLASISANLMKRSFAANLMRIAPAGSAPLFMLSGMAKERKITALAHSYYSKTALFPSVTLSAQSLAADTSFDVDSTENIKAGSMLMHYKVTAGTYVAPEIISVVSVDSATAFTALRGVGGTTAGTITSGSVLIEIGNAYEEASAAPTARAITMAEHTNFVQTFRDKWDASETAAAVALEPGVQLVAENKEDAMFFHANSIEFATLFGRKQATTRNGRPLRYMDGIESIVTQFAPNNIDAAGSTTTFKQLEAMLHPTLDNVVVGRNPGVKTLLCGSQAIQTINEIGRANGQMQFNESTTSFGMTFTKFKTSRGTFEMIEHPLLNSNNNLKKMAIVADLNTIDFLQLRPTNHKDIAYDGTDAISGVYTTELTVEMTNPLGWGIIYNLTAGA